MICFTWSSHFGFSSSIIPKNLALCARIIVDFFVVYQSGMFMSLVWMMLY